MGFACPSPEDSAGPALCVLALTIPAGAPGQPGGLPILQGGVSFSSGYIELFSL